MTGLKIRFGAFKGNPHQLRFFVSGTRIKPSLEVLLLISPGSVQRLNKLLPVCSSRLPVLR